MTISWRQYVDDHPRAVDVALIGLLLLAAAGPAVLNSDLSDTDNLSWRSAVPLAAAGSLALLWRRGHPRAVVGVTAICAGIAGGIGFLITPLLLAPVMVALYELAVRVPARTTVWYWLAATVSIAVPALLGDRYGYPWPLQVLDPALFLLLPIALAEAARLRQRHREEEARHRIADERVRIARDLHDVVAHHLALANAQAGTAAYVSRTQPEAAQRILAELTTTTSAALRELKATVGLLRQPGDAGSPLEPAPGLGQLPALTAALASAGLDVEVTVEGPRRPLPADVDLTAFRILQEALTNVTKHAGTGTARVRLSYCDSWLVLAVVNDAEPAAVTPGFGILGMRERAQAAGGRLRAEPGADGTFAVTAELPIP